MLSSVSDVPGFSKPIIDDVDGMVASTKRKRVRHRKKKIGSSVENGPNEMSASENEKFFEPKCAAKKMISNARKSSSLIHSNNNNHIR